MRKLIPASLLLPLRKINLLKDFWYVTLINRKRAALNRDKTVIIDISNPDFDNSFGRYVYLLIKFFSIANWNIQLKSHTEFIANINRLRYKKWLLNVKSLKIVSNDYEHADLTILDKFSDLKVISPKTIKVLSDKCDISDIQIPFSMHPYFYESGSYKKSEKLRSFDRKIRIIFSGNMDYQLYTKKVIKEKYNLLNRIEIITYVKEHVNKKVKLIDSREDFQSLLKSKVYVNQLVIGERIMNIDNWLEGLSKADFFLVCPGSDMPMCHNIIESISVGCIPIIEFPDQFSPPLKNFHNCLTFSGKDNLLEVIDLALEMEEEQINDLRNNIIEYYESYLTPEKVVSNLLSSEVTKLNYYMNISKPLYG